MLGDGISIWALILLHIHNPSQPSTNISIDGEIGNIRSILLCFFTLATKSWPLFLKP